MILYINYNCIQIIKYKRQHLITFPNLDNRVENYDVQQNILGEFQGAWKCDEILFLVLDIVHQNLILSLS